MAENEDDLPRGVFLWLTDQTKVLVKDAFIAGIWDGELIVSSDRTGTGMDYEVERSIPIANVRRAEIVTYDDDADPGHGVSDTSEINMP